MNERTAGSGGGAGPEARGPRTELRGRRVLIARGEERAAGLRGALESLGARASAVPLVRQVVVAAAGDVARLLAGEPFDHVLFTSPVAVRVFAECCERDGIAPDAWSRARVGAVGPATAAELRARGVEPELVGEGGAEALARAALASGAIGQGARVLLPRSAKARPELEAALVAAGARVAAPAIYDTVPEDPERIRPLLERELRPAPDAIVFASPSAVAAFGSIAGDPGRELLRAGGTRVVSIGPTTSAAVRAAGLDVAAEADRPGTEGLVEAVLRALR